MIEDRNLVPIIAAAQEGDEDAMTELLVQFKPLLRKWSRISGINNIDDNFQELSILMVHITLTFDMTKIRFEE